MWPSIIKVFDGKLFVCDVDWHSDYSQPIQYRTAWPTGLLASDHPEYVNMPCRAISCGLFCADGANMPYIALEFRDKTKPSPIYSEEREIKKPKGCKEYRNGQWYKF